MRRPRPAALCVLLALAACGPEAERDDATGTGDTSDVGDAGPRDRPRAARTPVTAPAARPAGLQRALDVLADAASDETAAARAYAVVLASGSDGAAALVDWLEFDFPDARRIAADRILRDLGADAVRPLLAVLEGAASRQDVRISPAADLLHALRATWATTDVAAEVASAALALAESGVNDGFRDDCLDLVLDAGAAAGPLAARLVAHLGGPDAEEWIDALGDRPDAAALILTPVAADLVPLLSAEDPDVVAGSKVILAAMDAPPRAAVDAVLRALEAADADARTAFVHVVAAWHDADPRLAERTSALLADPDPAVRVQVLEAWAADHDLAPDDVLRAARAVLDADPAVAESAGDLVVSWIANRDDGAAFLDTALRRASTDEALALCDVITRLDDEQVDPLVPLLVARTSSEDPRVRAAAFRALDESSWEVRADAIAAGVAHLDDPDPSVRAWAAWFADLDDEAPDDRIAQIALPLVRTLDDVNALTAAFRALRYTDEAAARAEAVRLLGHANPWVRYWAEKALEDAPGAPGDVLPQERVAELLDRLEHFDGEESALRVLLRASNGREAALDWLDRQLANGDRADVVRTLGYVLDDDGVAPLVLPSIRRLADREAFAELAEAALAWYEPDADRALARFEIVLPKLGDSERSNLIATRLVDLGARGAALLVRMDDAPDSWMADRVADREPEAVRAAVAELASAREARDRRIAARWAAVLEPAEAMPLLRTLVRDADEKVRWQALDVARDVAAEDTSLVADVAAWHVPALRSDDPSGAAVAARYLADVPRLPDGATAALRGLVASPDRDARACAAAALVLHDAGDDASLRAVVETLRPDGRGLATDTAIVCARAIERAGPRVAAAAPDAGTVLSRALLANGDEVQPHLVGAAGALGPAAAPCVPILRSALFHAIGLDEYAQESTELADAAARALGRIGAPAAPAVPDLRRLAKNSRFRSVAEEAIRAIESAPR